MSDVIIDKNIENGEWPESLSGSWAYIFYHEITGDTVMACFFDDDFSEGTVIEGYNITYQIPEAYVSWMPDGKCREIYVQKELRGRGIGTAMCAFARTYLYKKNGIVFYAPEKMTESAQSMLHKISEEYGEPYSNPENAVLGIPYGYWGGYLI